MFWTGKHHVHSLHHLCHQWPLTDLCHSEHHLSLTSGFLRSLLSYFVNISLLLECLSMRKIVLKVKFSTLKLYKWKVNRYHSITYTCVSDEQRSTLATKYFKLTQIFRVSEGLTEEMNIILWPVDVHGHFWQKSDYFSLEISKDILNNFKRKFRFIQTDTLLNIVWYKLTKSDKT